MSNTKETINKLRDQLQHIHESGDCGKILVEMSMQMNELASAPSDIDMVQKALKRFKASKEGIMAKGLVIYCDGSWEIEPFDLTKLPEGNNKESLLLWTKQTLGMEI